jgi:transposase
MEIVQVVRNSLPASETLTLEGVHESGDGIIMIRVRSSARPRCPACAGSVVSYHGQYDRRIRDLPWQGRQVELQLLIRRFRCRNAQCHRKIFAERLSAVVSPRARQTIRLRQIVGATGYALGGLPAHRLLQRLGISVSRDTILRIVKSRLRALPKPQVRVLGVDDWAWRKRQHYGTLLMDLESRRVIDLLPVRSATSFGDWLRGHPEIRIITRDRSTLYADGGRQGGPDAVQVLDRYHLVSNLSDAVERDVQQMQIQARAALRRETTPNSEAKADRLTLIEARRQRCREARYQRYVAVVELRQQGYTQETIGEKIGLQPETVASWLHANGFPERRIRSDRRRDSARYRQDVERGLHPSRARFNYSAGRIAALLVQPPPRLSSSQSQYLGDFLRLCPEGHRLRKLVLRFRAVLRWRKVKRLWEWIKKAIASGFRFTAQFAKTLLRDKAEVRLAVATPWNNGPLEGHVNRLKMIKRQMYGRAGFDLLKARVLPWEPARP